MQAKKTNPEKTKNPEMLTLDSTYRIGNRSFIVEPVFKEESSQTLGEVLLRLMKSESEKLLLTEYLYRKNTMDHKVDIVCVTFQ